MPFSFKLSHRLSLLRAAAGIAVLGAIGCTDRPAPTSSDFVPSALISSKFTIGDRVKTASQANIRSAPALSGALLGAQPGGALGTVVGGPVVDSAGDKLTRWQVDFDSGVDGWAAESYLTLVTPAPPPLPPVPVASVTVSPATASVTVGATAQLSVTLKDSAGNTLTGRTITWTSSNAAAATVSASGLVTGLAAGSATITATSEGKSGSATISVTAAAPGTFAIGARVKTASQANIRAAPAASGTLLGTQPAGALGTVIGGPVVDLAGDRLTRWQVDFDSGVDGWAAESYLTLVTPGLPPAPVASVTVTPATASVAVGATAQLAVTLKDAAGNTLTGRTVTWTTSNAFVATVSATGLVAGIAAGTATITATSEGNGGTAAITVTSNTSTGVHAGYYAAPSGSSGGDGSIGRPWDLRTALAGASGRVRPGDTVWVRGGIYGGSFRSTVAGIAGAPVVIRAYPGERAIIDENGLSGTTDGFVVAGPYEVIWGLEFTNSNPTRRFNDTNHSDRSNTVVNNAAHTKFVNIVIHDGGNAFYAWPAQPDLEIYGSIIYNNGWDGTDRGHGHGLYLKNNTGPVVVRHSVLFNQFGLGFHAYSNTGDGGLTNIQIRDNVAFNNGTISTVSTSQNLLLGGGEPVTRGVVSGNFTYFSPGAGGTNVTIGYSGITGNDVTVGSNYFVGGKLVFDMRVFRSASVSVNTTLGTSTMASLSSSAGQQWSGNLHYRDPSASAWMAGSSMYPFSGWQQTTGLGATDRAQSGAPGQTLVVVQPNQYERGRAHVIVYNWGRQGSVFADLSGVLTVGARYEVRSVQNLFGAPLVSGTYGGGSVVIPMTGQAPPVPTGLGSSPAPTTGPDFDVFLVTMRPN